MLKRDQMHDYQNYCVDFIKGHPESLLILDMGLGKTIISLTAILDLMYDSFEISKALVIAPLRVGRETWPSEAELWEHTKDLKLSVMIGDCKQRSTALRQKADIYIINRENVKWLVDYLERHRIPWPFDFVVIDELSSFKNYKAQRYKALRKIRPYIKRIVGLTGTPAAGSRGLEDLWAEVGMIDKWTRLGRFIGAFREDYMKPGAMNPGTGVVYNYVPLPGAEEKIYEKISDITISMKALDFLDMPEKLVVNHEVRMDPDEWELYRKLQKDLVLSIGKDEIDAKNAAVLSGKLLQMAGGAIYTKDEEVIRIHDHKLDMLEDLIEQANGQSVLVAYWFRHEHDRIIERLHSMGIEGRELKTSKDLSDWNEGKVPVALISPASAGHGLNIQYGGHILIWFSLPWSLELYLQTVGRLWRQNQKEIVSVHHIICKGTVDENVIAALENKNMTQENLIAAVKANLQEEA